MFFVPIMGTGGCNEKVVSDQVRSLGARSHLTRKILTSPVDDLWSRESVECSRDLASKVLLRIRDARRWCHRICRLFLAHNRQDQATQRLTIRARLQYFGDAQLQECDALLASRGLWIPELTNWNRCFRDLHCYWCSTPGRCGISRMVLEGRVGRYSLGDLLFTLARLSDHLRHRSALPILHGGVGRKLHDPFERHPRESATEGRRTGWFCSGRTNLDVHADLPSSLVEFDHRLGLYRRQLMGRIPQWR